MACYYDNVVVVAVVGAVGCCGGGVGGGQREWGSNDSVFDVIDG